ncbi:MAG TPA: glycosyltransferase family 39 protein [Pyrinomonadaceae bacterium]|nr:glycosyltransferase family 39 protein [Pyrinomonadaceae bacterium]
MGTRSLSRVLLATMLSMFVLAGLGFRTVGLSKEALSEDELNKLNAVTEYRAKGLTSANGEHPLLMKAALTVSVIVCERWNNLVAAHPELYIPVETSLRIPGAILGALSAVLVFLIAMELFGLEVGLISAALWSFDPLTISFNRIAKEDTFLVFFFLLMNVFWLRGQRVAESQPHRKPDKFYWAAAASFGAMMASKYVPQLLSIPVAYYYIFQGMPSTRWRLGKKKFLKFFLVMGVAFLVFNPTILLPDTWRTILKFTGYKLMGHDSYEFIGRLYPHRMADWLRGEPWYFYFVLLGVKLPIAALVAFAGGCVLLLRRATGDGRYFLWFWLLMWGLTFTFAGGKFTRYATSLMPAVIMTAALAIQFAGRHLGKLCRKLFEQSAVGIYARAALVSVVIISTMWAAANASPHFRLYMNSLGGGNAKAGTYFPQDEFYDAYMMDAMKEIAARAQPSARVGTEIPILADYYAQRAGRSDLDCLEFSVSAELAKLSVGDFLIDARGRTYFSNQSMLARLRQTSKPAFTVFVGSTPAADVYVLDQASLSALRGN